MGVDIHMSIINKNGEYIEKNVDDDRDYEWFDNLQGNGDNLYDTFPYEYGIPENSPKDITEDYNDNCYYGFHHILVKDFLNWVEKYKPEVDAKWVSTYDKWLYETKGIYPHGASRYLDEDMNTADYHFIEVVDKGDHTKWLYDKIKNNENICEDDYIVYYFDR